MFLLTKIKSNAYNICVFGYTDILVLKQGENTVKKLIGTLKALSDEIRLRIINLLSSHDELCVCKIVDALSLPQSTVSRHLTILKNAGIIQDRKHGQWIYYKLLVGKDDGSFIEALINSEFKKNTVLEKDAEVLKKQLDKKNILGEK